MQQISYLINTSDLIIMPFASLRDRPLIWYSVCFNLFSCQQTDTWNHRRTRRTTKESRSASRWDGGGSQEECLQELLPVHWDSKRNIKFVINISLLFVCLCEALKNCISGHKDIWGMTYSKLYSLIFYYDD